MFGHSDEVHSVDEVQNCVLGWMKSTLIAAATSSEHRVAKATGEDFICGADLFHRQVDFIAFAPGKCLIPIRLN